MITIYAVFTALLGCGLMMAWVGSMNQIMSNNSNIRARRKYVTKQLKQYNRSTRR